MTESRAADLFLHTSRTSGRPSKPGLPRLALTASLLGVLALGACAQTPPPAPPASSGFSAGLTVTEQVSASDLGLPLYPGAQPRREGANDKPSINFDLWGNTLGIKLVVAKYQTGDDAERVARFYRQAMARQGTVLDCGDPQAPRGKNSQALSCENDRPEAGARLYKVGQPRSYRVVGVRPLADGQTELSLVRVETR